MELFVIIPKLKKVNEEEFEKSKKAVLNQWSSDFDIKLVVEEGTNYPEIFNNAIDKISGGYVMFLYPFVILKDRALENCGISKSDTGEDTLVFSYEKMSFNELSNVELSSGKLSLKDFLLVLHEHPGDVTYTSLWNKILSADIIKKHGIRFDSRFKESYEYAFLLEYLKYAKGIYFSDQRLATFYTQPQPELLAKERIIEKKRLFELYEKLLSDECDHNTATDIMNKERLSYVVYEYQRISESTSVYRKEIKELLSDMLSRVSDMSLKAQILLRLRIVKARAGKIKNYWFNERRNILREESSDRAKQREAFLQKHYYKIRVPYRVFHRRFSKVKNVLLYCESQTMKSHIFDYYNCVKDMTGVRFFIYYPGGWDHETPSNVTLIKSHAKALTFPWDILILADAKVPLYYSRNEAGLIYINHGLHMISYDGGDTLYAYDAGKGLFSAMLEPNKAYADILSKEYSDECIRHVGYKNAEAIIEQKKNRKLCRDKFGFDDETKVIAVFGSWGMDSLFHKVGNSLITQAKEMMKDNYKFILSIHPKEYSRYDETVEPLGEYVESLESEGFIIRNPKTPSVDYMVAADLVICDFTTLCEEAMLAGKPVILSDFSSDRVWKYSIIARYQQNGPSFSNKDNLKDVIEKTIDDKELSEYARGLVDDLIPPNDGYKNAVKNVTQKVIQNL